jgi:DNA modification methylase
MIEIIGDATLYLGDCEEILPEIGFVDAVVTDPPYGINADKKQSQRANKKSINAITISKDYGLSNWDSGIVKNNLIKKLINKSNKQIIFGGNYYNLPPTKCWFIWDKMNGSNTYADFEMVWTNLDKACRKIDWLWHGMLRKDNEERFHPTQKPCGLMVWCINQLPEKTNTILDPFMGSGTTGVASINLGKKFVGIEREQKYFDIACKRIEQAESQGDLFMQKHSHEQLNLMTA